jgi:two-component system, chemotaxis family, CheB/CheR fusion protein
MKKTSSSRSKKKAAVRAATPVSSSKPVVIVGVGASAGGLEAFRQLLAPLPADTGMAFIFVQHIQAKSESMLTKIISSATRMPTVDVRDGLRVESNHVYVITPNNEVLVDKGVLKVSARTNGKSKYHPIDTFLSSLAQDQGARAVGIILSGTASDGTLGLESVRAEGGITFAQAPATAKFDGMPVSAISANCVDFVLSPEQIAAKLKEISKHPYVERARLNDESEIVAAAEEDWAQLFNLLKASAGVDFTFYKKTTIKRRVARRMALLKSEQLATYVKILESNPEELEALQDDLLIHVTSFFREPDVFQAFQKKILPKILKGLTPAEPIRIWIAGCSTGEEVYSLAIAILEVLGKQKTSIPLQVFGTDVSEQSIKRARSGIYPEIALSHVSPQRLKRFFSKIDGSYQINSGVRDLCVFARHDLTRDPPFSRLDVIACRNVLIYLEPVLQRRVIGSFHYALKNTGFLLLGKSETLGSYSDMFTATDIKNKIFARKSRMDASYASNTVLPHKIVPSQNSKPAEPKTFAQFDLEKEADRFVWERYSHAGVVVDNELQILQFRGDTSPYLRPVSGKATYQLLRMLREELVLEVRAAIHKARRTGSAVRRDAIGTKFHGTSRDVSIEVLPFQGPARREKYFVVLFEEDSRSPAPRPKEVETSEDRNSATLRKELKRTREYLQSIVQEQESTNEELKTANEEALSSMEELQSSNEELETAKEELQSTNEELITLNEQLQNRTAELARSNDDLASVLSSVSIPIIMLGPDRRVRRFTPAAEKLLHLIPGDIGRPLRAMRIGFEIPGLEIMIETVMNQGTEIRQEAKAENGRWFSLRLFPYRTSEQLIEGVLLAFVDIHELRETQDAVRAEIALTSAILDAATDLLVVVLDGDGRIVRFNQACQDLTGYTEGELKNRQTWEFLVPIEAVADAKLAFDKAAAGTPSKIDYPWLTKTGRRVTISWSNTSSRSDQSVKYVICAGIDITERREATDQVREKEATVQALLESASQAILATDREGTIVLGNVAAERMFGYSREELLSMSVDMLIPERFRKDQAHDREVWFSNPENWFPLGRREITARRKDGAQFPAEVNMSSVNTKDGLLSVSFISDVSEKREQEMLMRSMTAALISMEESRGRNIARELHDDISQKLAALGMETAALLNRDGNSSEVLAARIRGLGSGINSLTEDVQRMSRHLHPKILDDLGLEVAVREECISLAKTLGIAVKFQSNNVPRIIPEDTELCLFRVSQEALRNIAKHAMAKEVEVTLARSRRSIVLAISDVGDGFDLDQPRHNNGLGLVSMEERVRLVGGMFRIHSQPGHGTQIEVQVPLPETKS